MHWLKLDTSWDLARKEEQLDEAPLDIGGERNFVLFLLASLVLD